MPKLCLVDGTQIAYRAHFAFLKNPLTSPKTGELTGAVFGFARAIMKLLEQNPDYMAVAFDSKALTFRHEQFSDYKANRPPMPDELIGQMERIKEVVEAFSVCQIAIQGFEGDDILGTLARRAEESGVEVTIVSADKDLLQLVSPSVRLLVPGRGGDDEKLMGEKEVMEKYGISPGQVIDMLALAGDTSDNIPGVKGIGEKTALKLIKKYGCIEALFESGAVEESTAVREKLERGRESAFLSKELATIRCDAPVPPGLDSLTAKPADAKKLSMLADELGFRWLRNFMGASDGIDGAYETLNADNMDAILDRLRTSDVIALSVISGGQSAMEGAIHGIAVSDKPGSAVYFPFDSLEGEAQSVTLTEFGQAVLMNEASVKAGHNLKDMLMLFERNGMSAGGGLFDVSVAGYLLNPGGKTDIYSLLESRGMGSLNERKGAGPEELRKLACVKADSILRLYGVLKNELAAEGMESVFTDTEMPLLAVLKDMQISGVHVDTGILKRMSDELAGELSRIENEIYEASGCNFNINSPQQLAEVLFEKHNLPRGRKTKKGYSTDSDVLEDLAVSFDLPRKIIDYRQLSKLKNTYLDALPQAVNAATGRIHASFNQTITATGRLSSSDPNLQNIPFRGELGRGIRKAFRAQREGWVMLSADYSQIELRILAHLSGDRELTRAFENGEDVHTMTAARIFDVDEAFVSEDMRAKAKVVNFGVIYGMSPFGLARQLRISRERAKQFIQKFFESYEGVSDFIDGVLDDARREGVVRTMTGRKRHFPEILSANERIRSEAERAAINTPVQGSAADIIKTAMVRISAELKKSGTKAMLVLQIHDELLLELPGNEVQEVGALVKNAMENAVPLSVPVLVRTGNGESWYDAH